MLKNVFKKLVASIIRRQPTAQSQMGICDVCGSTFEYELLHCGYSDMGYAYCERCGCASFLSAWSADIPANAHLRVQRVICAETEPYLNRCDCGGSFRSNSSPRCPDCLECLSAERATSWLEANAPGAKIGWNWQRNWSGVYCIVIKGRRVLNNWNGS